MPICRFAPQYFAEPGPATTSVPLPVLAYDTMMVEIDAFAMKRRPGPSSGDGGTEREVKG